MKTFIYPFQFFNAPMNIFVAFIGMIFEYILLIIVFPFLLYLRYIKNKEGIQQVSNTVNTIGTLFQTIIHTILFWLITIIFFPLILLRKL